MIRLPRGKAVKEAINPVRMDWLEALEKLHGGRFSGYLYCSAGKNAGLVLFVQGALSLARFSCGTVQQDGAPALSRLFALALSGAASLSIFRLTTDLAARLHDLLQGEFLYRAQEREILDIPYLLGQLREEFFSGGLLVRAAERAALIFYQAGVPLGFFHDGAQELSEQADLNASVAWLPGAKVDVIRTDWCTEPERPDLLRDMDLLQIWQEALVAAGPGRETAEL